MIHEADAAPAPPHPAVFFLRSIGLAAVVAAALWPMYRGDAGPAVLAWTCAIALAVTTGSYLVSVASLSWSATWQYGVLVGGFFVRMVVVVGAVLALILVAEFPAARTVVALIAFYLVLLFHESWSMYRRVANHG